MTFKPGAQLDPGQVRDRRGRGGIVAIGGGLGGIVLLVVVYLLGGDPAEVARLLDGTTIGGAQEPNSSVIEQCQSGADANARDD